MLYNQLSTENLKHWLDKNGYSNRQIAWLVYYSQRIDVSQLMNKTFSPDKIRLLARLIRYNLDTEYIEKLKVEDSVWSSMLHVVTHYGDTFSSQ